MPGWGGIPWGGGPWGAGDALSVLFAEAVGENAVRVVFNVPVKLENLGDFDDGLTAANYAVAAVTFEARDVAVAAVERDGDEVDSVVLRLDRAMSGAEALYDARVARVRGAAGEALDPAAAFFEFLGCARFVPPALLSTATRRFVDIANPQTLADRAGVTAARLGTIPVDDSGDYARDEGLVNIRKRVLRRLMTPLGGFYHLPEYGVGLPDRAKRTMTLVEMRDLQVDAQRQITSEPGVLGATVGVQRDGSILRVAVRVRSAGGEDRFEVPFRLGEAA